MCEYVILNQMVVLTLLTSQKTSMFVSKSLICYLAFNMLYFTPWVRGSLLHFNKDFMVDVIGPFILISYILYFCYCSTYESPVHM